MGRKLEFDRRKALETAMEYFWVRGYEETSMRELADKLELHMGSLYNALGTKEAVFEKALRLHFDMHVHPHLESMTSSQDPVDAIGKYLNVIADECGKPTESFGCFIMNSLHEITQINDSVTGFLHEIVGKTEEAFAVCVERGQAAGDIDPAKNPRKLARFLVATIYAMRALAKLGMPADRIRDVKKCALQALVD